MSGVNRPAGTRGYTITSIPGSASRAKFTRSLRDHEQFPVRVPGWAIQARYYLQREGK
jgi:hypothetical protein